MLLYIGFLACVTAISLICGLHYLQELGQSDKACKKRESPPELPPRNLRHQFKVIIIGGSTSGLTMAARLEQSPNAEYVVLEENESCGTRWRQFHDRLHLRTIKEVSGLPGLPLPAYYPVYPSKDQMADYYDASGHLLNVKTSTCVTSATFDQETQQWTVRTRPCKKEAKVIPSVFSAPTTLSASSGEQPEHVDIDEPTVEVFTSRVLVVCTGGLAVPVMPDLPGRDKFTGQVLHASEYKNGREFAQKKVLVVGADSTGAEIALDLWEHDARVGLLSSTPVVILRRALLRPLLLFYPLSRLIPQRVRRRLYDFLAPQILGKLSELNLQLPHLSKLKKSDPIPPVWVDVGTLDLVRRHEVTVFSKDISTFIPNGVIFKDGKEEVFDAVILNTGFKKTSYVPFLEPETGKEPISGTRRASRQLEVPPQDGVEVEKKGLYFVGFSDAFFKLREDHYATEQICRDIALKKYI